MTQGKPGAVGAQPRRAAVPAAPGGGERLVPRHRSKKEYDVFGGTLVLCDWNVKNKKGYQEMKLEKKAGGSIWEVVVCRQSVCTWSLRLRSK